MNQLQNIEIALWKRADMGRRLGVNPANQRLLNAAADYALHLWGAVADHKAVRLQARS